MAKTLTAIVPRTNANLNAGATEYSSVVDAQALDDGQLIIRMVPNATLTVRTVANVLVARKQGSTPTAAAPAAGDDAWKLVASFATDLVSGNVSMGKFDIRPAHAFICVQFVGGTGGTTACEVTGNTVSY